MVPRLASPHARRVYASIDGPRLATGLGIDAEISDSWRRCLTDFGLDPTDPGHRPQVLQATALRERRERMEPVLRMARPDLEHLYRQIAGSGFSILFTDDEGVILDALTDDALSRDFERAGLRPGADWSEAREGTNGIGTALREMRPVTVHLDDHFQSSHTALTCSGAPLFGPDGKVLGVLDVSSTSSTDSKQSQRATLALVNMTNKLVENSLFMEQFRDRFVLRLHPNRHYLGLVCEGLLALSGEGRILAANQSAASLLQVTRHGELNGRAIDEVFDHRFESLVGANHRDPGCCIQLRQTSGGMAFFARLEPPTRRAGPSGAEASSPPVRKPEPAKAERGLDQLARGDLAMCHIIECARRVMDRNIPILIQGQTGSGKEALAKAIHDASQRRAERFVAVNCASIPESLIESELFGYKGGAFTGARREGMRGKIVQSSNGTLFLDEIGDMPLSLQTRLLRVLEDGLVYPLGCESPVPVKLNVIAATHQDLPGMVREQRFREDLYFRLNGIILHVPPLRERQDIRYLIEQLVALEAEHAGAGLDEAVVERLAAHHWPGNIRQLRNVIRVALALADHGQVLVEHLPAEIRGGGASGKPMEAPDHRPSLRSASADRDALGHAERQALLMQLERHRWNVSSTARSLSISRATLYRKMKRHGLGKG